VLLLENRTVKEESWQKIKVMETENWSFSCADLQGLRIPRPSNQTSEASITCSESLGGWRQSLGNKTIMAEYAG